MLPGSESHHRGRRFENVQIGRGLVRTEGAAPGQEEARADAGEDGAEEDDEPRAREEGRRGVGGRGRDVERGALAVVGPRAVFRASRLW